MQVWDILFLILFIPLISCFITILGSEVWPNWARWPFNPQVVDDSEKVSFNLRWFYVTILVIVVVFITYTLTSTHWIFTSPSG